MGHHQLSSEAGTPDGISKFKDGKHGDKAGGGFDGELDVLDGAALPGKAGTAKVEPTGSSCRLRGCGEAKTAKENRSRRQSKSRDDMKEWGGEWTHRLFYGIMVLYQGPRHNGE